MATIPEALAIAVEHHQNGRLQAAEQIYRRILAAEPNHADAMHLLGVIAWQAGKHEIAVEFIERAVALKSNAAVFHNNLGEAYRALGKLAEAEACCRKAAELEPEYAAARANLGHALKDQGHFDEAIACYRRALELKPDFAEVHNNLGIALKAKGQFEEAIACYRQALELKPDYVMAHNNLGVAFKEQGKLADAIACYRRALALQPDYAVALSNLGIALNEQGQFEEALACFRRALELKPDYAEGHSNLGIAFKEQGMFDEAVASFRRALDLKPDSAEVYSNLGVALKEQSKLDEAIACWRKALDLKPDFAEVHVNLGSTLEELGDFRSAEGSFRAALGCNPRLVLAHYKLAEVLGGKLPEVDLETQRRLLEDGSLTNAQRLSLEFGLARVADARGEYAEAARRLECANALQLSGWRNRGQNYEPDVYASHVAQMIAVCGPEFFERVRGFGLESELPVFIVGLPRSGTTLVEQILAGHSQVFSAGEILWAHESLAELCGDRGNSLDELRRLNRDTAQRVARRHLERLQALQPAALRIADKMPENYMFLGILAALFPRAKFIHCRRDLRDIAASCWMTHFEQVRWANDQLHIASRFQQYLRVMDHWRKVLPAPLLDVDYEETVTDLEAVARRLISWCGLDWEAACLGFQRVERPVRTASAVQVRQPIFTTSVGRWKNYERALAPLFASLPTQ